MTTPRTAAATAAKQRQAAERAAAALADKGWTCIPPGRDSAFLSPGEGSSLGETLARLRCSACGYTYARVPRGAGLVSLVYTMLTHRCP